MDTQNILPTHTDTATLNNTAAIPSVTPLLTIPDTARRLTISVRSVYRLIEKGELTVVRVLPDTPRIRATDIDALIARRLAEANTPTD